MYNEAAAPSWGPRETGFRCPVELGTGTDGIEISQPSCSWQSSPRASSPSRPYIPFLNHVQLLIRSDWERCYEDLTKNGRTLEQCPLVQSRVSAWELLIT